MCRISKESVMRAQEALKIRARAGRLVAPEMTEGGFNVSVRAFGRTYSHELTRKEIKEAYGRSLKSVRMALVDGKGVSAVKAKIAK